MNPRHWSPVIIGCLLLTALPSTSSLDLQKPPCSSPTDFVEVPGQGPSCWTGSAWMLRLPDGKEILTHGPETVGAVGIETIDMPAPVMPPCAETGQAYIALVYARPPDTPDAFATMAPQILTMLGQMNAFLLRDTLPFSRGAQYRVECDATGAPVVHNVMLLTPSAAASFYTIAAELRQSGFIDEDAKYAVWYDRQLIDSMRMFAGQGELYLDERAGPENDNNMGGQIAVVYEQYGDYGAAVMMHENGHNMGAVQVGTPNASGNGGFHCNDGLDIMCYGDGGERSNYQDAVCDDFHFDCGADDYFAIDPVEDSYVATHWNVASPVNRFLAFLDHEPSPVGPETVCDWDLYSGGVMFLTGLWRDPIDAQFFHSGGGYLVTADRAYRVRPACQGAAFVLEPVKLLDDFDVCWEAQGQVLRCDINAGAEQGSIPIGADVARVYVRGGVDPHFFLRAGEAVGG